jgi:hypothetical protein
VSALAFRFDVTPTPPLAPGWWRRVERRVELDRALARVREMPRPQQVLLGRQDPARLPDLGIADRAAWALMVGEAARLSAQPWDVAR